MNTLSIVRIVLFLTAFIGSFVLMLRSLYWLFKHNHVNKSL